MDMIASIGFIVFLALWAPLIPLFGGGVQFFPGIGEGLGSIVVGWAVILVIVAMVVTGLRYRASWYGKGLAVLGVGMWLLWGIACIPAA